MYLRLIPTMFAIFLATVASAEGTPPITPPAVNSELTKNLKALESYYDAVNQQLDKRLQRQARDPFADASPEPKAEEKKPASDVAPFIPHQQEQPAQTAEEQTLQTTPSFRRQNGNLPRMRFKGFISAGKNRAALLDISGIGTFVVHESDKIGLQQLNSDMVLRIVEINPLNIIVEVGSLGEKLVVQ